METLATEDFLDRKAFLRSLRIAGHTPDTQDWRQFIDHLLGVLGTVLILAGIGFFFAYNWAELGRFAKFSLIGALIFCAVVIAARQGLDSKIGKLALIGAAGLTGILLAVYGQTYQTGADAYGLFLVWAALISGWVLISRSKPMWMLCWVLLNLSLVLYWGEVLYPQSNIAADLAPDLGALILPIYLFSDAGLSETLAGLNAIALISYEWLSLRGQVPWLRGRWPPRSIASLMLAALIIPTLVFIFSSSGFASENQALKIAPALYLIATAITLAYYHTRGRDLFILTLSYFGVISVTTAAIGKQLGDHFAGYALLGLLILILSAGVVAILRLSTRAWKRGHT